MVARNEVGIGDLEAIVEGEVVGVAVAVAVVTLRATLTKLTLTSWIGLSFRHWPLNSSTKYRGPCLICTKITMNRSCPYENVRLAKKVFLFTKL